MIFKVPGFWVAITIFVNSRLFINEQDLGHRSYSARPAHERVISNKEFYLLDQDDQQVILVKVDSNPAPIPTRGSGPNNFPVSPPSGGRPSRPVTGVNPYRTPPKVVDRGLGGAPNLAGTGGGGENAEFDDTCPAP